MDPSFGTPGEGTDARGLEGRGDFFPVAAEDVFPPVGYKGNQSLLDVLFVIFPKWKIWTGIGGSTKGNGGVWVKIKLSGANLHGLVLGSIYQGNPFWVTHSHIAS